VPGRTSITLSWRASPESDVAGYQVFRREDGTGYAELTSELVTAGAFTDAAVTPGIEYGYVVKAVDESGNASTMSREVRSTAGMWLRLLQTRQANTVTVTLQWSGAESSEVAVLRNGAVFSTTVNDGSWTDATPLDTGVYQVCEAGTSDCTNQVQISIAERRRSARP
jgi:fibronectin type 3 domain-containing protein